MTIDHLEKALEEILPDQQILVDLKKTLTPITHKGVAFIELDVQEVRVPLDSRMEIVSKVFFKEYYATVGFGVFRVLIALGGFLPDKHGAHRAEYCFATLYYNGKCQLITNDFHEEFR